MKSFSFVNYADASSCDQAVEHMNNFVVKGSRLNVNPAPVNHLLEEI
jgi:RNA recognition motif-containing protein